MKIAVRYQSRGGNTKAVAEAIANTAGTKAEPIDVPISEPVDHLFIGGGVYALNIDRSLKEYLEKLSPDTVKSLAAFTTCGNIGATGKIIDIAKTKGITVCENDLSIKMRLKNYRLFGGQGNVTLSEKHLRAIADFVKDVTNA